MRRYTSEPAFVPLPLAPHRARPGRHQAGAPGPLLAHPENPACKGGPDELEMTMHKPPFFAGREQQLRDLIDHPREHDLDRAACAGADTDAYHPDDGQPDELSLFRCQACAARLACLALALRAEDPEARAGWYGGLGPADRDDVAASLQLGAPRPVPPERAMEAARLRAAGWTIAAIAAQLACSRRTVQRYLRTASG
jgi:AraC-like DNA-binding protein